MTSVAKAFVRRLHTLPERTQRALLLAAAAGSGDLSGLAGAAAPLAVDLDDLAAAEEAGLVALSGGRLEFRHPLVRSAVYSDATPKARREAHRALADALPDLDADRRAWHLALAAVGPDDAAASALEQAGRRARERSAYVVACNAFERAARLVPGDERRAQLLHAAAEAAWLAGLADRATTSLDEARTHVPDGRGAYLLEHLRGHIAAQRGPAMVGHEILTRAASAAGKIDPERAALMLAEAVSSAFYAGDAAAMQAAAAMTEPLSAANGGGRTLFFARVAQGMALIFSGAGEPGAAALREAVAVFDGWDDLAEDPRMLMWAAVGPLWLREAGFRPDLIERALSAARGSTAVGVLPTLLTLLAIDQAGGERWGAARSNLDEAMRLARETGQRTELAAALSRTAWLDARQGREQESRTRAAEALELSDSLGLGLCEIWTRAALADLELGFGRPAEALDRLEELERVLEARGVADVDLSPAPEIVDVLLRLRRDEEAAAAASAFGEAAAAKGQPWALARAARLRGLLAPPDRMDADFEDALRLHRLTPDVFETARTQLAYGSRLRRSRRRVVARDQLRAAIDVFDQLGAAPWDELARTELAATGETARRRDPSTLGDLTPQEFQIAQLLAGGSTTREAAASLFLSPKTIEYHLRNAYRKLGIHSREELANALVEIR